LSYAWLKTALEKLFKLLLIDQIRRVYDSHFFELLDGFLIVALEEVTKCDVVDRLDFREGLSNHKLFFLILFIDE